MTEMDRQLKPLPGRRANRRETQTKTMAADTEREAALRVYAELGVELLRDILPDAIPEGSGPYGTITGLIRFEPGAASTVDPIEFMTMLNIDIPGQLRSAWARTVRR